MHKIVPAIKLMLVVPVCIILMNHIRLTLTEDKRVKRPYIDGSYFVEQETRPHLERHPVTIVTAYYPLQTGAKHTLADYDAWMSRFFPHVKTPVVAFLPSGPVIEKVKEMRQELPLTIIETALWNMDPNTRLRQQYEGPQYEIDPEKSKHCPALYAIWNSKSWMLRTATEKNRYNSTYFLWVDAGAWRDRQFSSWPDVQKLDNLYSIPSYSSRMLLSSAKVLNKDEDGFRAGTWYIQGGFFGGTKSAIEWWTTEYYRLLEEWVGNGRFAGKDQELMTDISLRYPHRRFIIRSFGGGHGDPWFFFQPFLAKTSELSTAELSDARMNTSDIFISSLVSYE